MPRKKEWPPRPHAHGASGQDRVSVNGKHIYLGKTGSPEAALAYADLLKRLVEQKPPEPPPRKPRGTVLTIAELVEKWQAHADAKYSLEGREASQFVWACEPLLAKHATLPVADFDANRLEEVRDEMIRLDWSHKVIGRRITRVRTMWRWACRKGLAPKGSWEALRELEPLAPNDRRVKRLPPRQGCAWHDLARVCRFTNRTVRAMLLFEWFTGARPGEVRHLLVGEIDRSEGVWIANLVKHKNAWRGQTRAIAIGPRAQRVIRDFIDGKKAGQHVFESTPGRGYADESYCRAVARASERAGVVGVTPYSARHSYKTRVKRADGLDTARAGLGQASLSTTDLYDSGQDLELAKKAARNHG